MIEIKPVSQTDKFLKVLVYGDAGVGKTSLAATATQNKAMEKTLIVNVEGGMLSITGSGAMATEQIKSIKDVEDIMWALSSKQEGFEHYNTCVIDSGTELQTLDLEEIAEAARKKNSSREVDTVYLEDYGKSTTRLKRIFRHFRDLPMNVIVTALVKREMPPMQSQKRDPIRVLPQFTAKLGDSLMGYVDAVWYMYEDDGVRHLLTQPEGPYMAKTRGHNFSAAIGKDVENPNLSELYDILQKTEGTGNKK